MNEGTMIVSEQYDHIDGKNAYQSMVKRLTLGKPYWEENKNTQIAVQMWKQEQDGTEKLYQELSIHQVMDLMIFLSRTILHFQDAYRFELLYDPNNPGIDRIGVQGDAMNIAICTNNPEIQQDMKVCAQALSDLGEITGERLRVLARLLKEIDSH